MELNETKTRVNRFFTFHIFLPIKFCGTYLPMPMGIKGKHKLQDNTYNCSGRRKSMSLFRVVGEL